MLLNLGVIGELHNDECIRYISKGEVKDGTTKIFTNSQYDFKFLNFRDRFLPVFNNTRHENVHF